jgi:hypothetical protein
VSNRKNGGGTYAYNNTSGSASLPGDPAVTGLGIGPELGSDGSILDPNVGANLTRITLGTNYQVNANTQWKTEYRVDQSTGYNFLDSDAVTYKKSKTGFATSLVLSF